MSLEILQVKTLNTKSKKQPKKSKKVELDDNDSHDLLNVQDALENTHIDDVKEVGVFLMHSICMEFLREQQNSNSTIPIHRDLTDFGIRICLTTHGATPHLCTEQSLI